MAGEASGTGAAGTEVAAVLGEATIIGRRGFADALAAGLRSGEGFATGKLGGTERALLREPIIRGSDLSPLQRRAFDLHLRQLALPHAGIFPTDAAFMRRFCDRFADAVGALDVIGIDRTALPETAPLLAHHRPPGALVDYLEQEPDRSIPADDRRCWLPLLRGRRILLVCPFATVLCERADRATYEAVWEKIGKRWFEPASVEAVELPYGFDPATRDRYADALELCEEIVARIGRHDYDVALIAAGGLGIPIAARVRAAGRVGFSIGGHLQPMFGVSGERWLSRPFWREHYINDAWVGLPERYRAPSRGAAAEDYW